MTNGKPRADHRGHAPAGLDAIFSRILLACLLTTMASVPTVLLAQTRSTTTTTTTTAQIQTQPSLNLVLDAEYSYENSEDFNGALPYPTQLPFLGTDLLSWYRSLTGVSKSVDNITSTEPEPNPYLLLKLATQYQQQSAGIMQPSTTITSGGPVFDVDEFEQGIIDKLDSETVGYAYVINFKKKHSRSDGRGAARNNNDSYLAQSQYKRMNIASISKTITAVAVLQLLELNDLNVFDPVGPWLPDDWTKGYGFANPQIITFYDLLTHKSGIKQTAMAIQNFDAEFAALNLVKWNGLKAMVEYGIMPQFHGGEENQSYSNINYALFRVIIPALWEAAGQPINALDANEAAAVYQAYVAENVFLPLDIHQPSCVSATGDYDPTRYYNVFEANGTGAEAGNWTLSCGSGGWYLSAYELAKFMAYLRYSDRILSDSMRELMDLLDLGWSYNWSLSGDHGRYQAHAGALYFDSVEWPERREQQGCIMKFPIQVEAVLLVNSSIETNTLPCTVLRNAFDAAWVN